MRREKKVVKLFGTLTHDATPTTHRPKPQREARQPWRKHTFLPRQFVMSFSLRRERRKKSLFRLLDNSAWHLGRFFFWINHAREESSSHISKTDISARPRIFHRADIIHDDAVPAWLVSGGPEIDAVVGKGEEMRWHIDRPESKWGP